MKLKKIFTNWRVILLLVFLVFALISIKPSPWVEGVTIRSVGENSSASNAGIENPNPKLSPLAKERVISVNGELINSVEEYHLVIEELEENKTVRLETNKGFYSLIPQRNTEEIIDLGLKVYAVPSSNIKKGLDLEGGTRVLLKPAEKVSDEDMEIILDNLKERLNVYGLGDVVVRTATDLAGVDYVLIEMAGVTEEEVKELVAKQGKFEAKIGNQTVFFGGKKDITYVCRSADCSGIDPARGCSRVNEGWACAFFFGITLSPEAAERQAELTDQLEVVNEEGESYLNKDLILFLDDKEVDVLRIGAELKGRATTNIQISGSGAGKTQGEAAMIALQNMKRLQTIIITGGLPVKLDIVKVDTISSVLGKEFLDNAILIGFLAALSVASVVLLRYRKGKIVLPMVLTLISEVVLVLGFAALVGWNLDLASIAGIIIIVGTGVDHLIIITDETLKGKFAYDWKEKIKRAMFIVMAAYFTTCAGMIPLWFAGAGLLKGFAFTTIVGISFGVLIARPAYAAMIEILVK
jgi:preprotein translocase subunit SecD